MSENIPALITRAREAAVGGVMDHPDPVTLFVELADALESLSAPPATDDALPERLEAQATFVPETRMADVMLEAAEVIRAARHPSPLTREALAKEISLWLMENRTSNQRSADEQGAGIADAILARFALPEPAEVEWNWMQDDTGQVPFTEGFASYEDAALFGPPGTAPAHIVRRTKATPAGPGVPVKGTEQ